MMRSKVDLPQPDGPTNTVNAPSSTARSTPCSTFVVPKLLVTPEMSRRAMGSPQPREGRFGKPARPGLDGEDAAGERRVGQLLGGEADARAGHVEQRQVRPAEGAARGARHGQGDDAVDRAVRRIAGDAPAVPVRAPDIALGVDGEAVRRAGALGTGRSCGGWRWRRSRGRSRRRRSRGGRNR